MGLDFKVNALSWRFPPCRYLQIFYKEYIIIWVYPRNWLKSRNLATCSFVGVNSKVNIHSQQVTIHNIIYWKHKWNLRALSPIFLVYKSCNVNHWPERKNYVNLKKSPDYVWLTWKITLHIFLACKQEPSHR